MTLGRAFREGFGVTLLLCNLLLPLSCSQRSPLVAQSLAPQVPANKQNAEAVTTLEAGKPIERELAGGEKHEFQITLAEGQYASLVVEQRGIDVVARLLGSDGKSIVDFDSEIRNQGDEPVELTTEAAGNYRLTVEAKQRSAPKGRYEIRIIEVRPATERERALHEARKLLTEENRLYRAGKYDQAFPLVERALAIREKELGTEHADFGQALFMLANLYNDKGDYAKAESLYRRALAIREKALGKDHLGITPILNNLGNLIKDKGDYAEAELLYERSFEIRAKSLDPDHILIASSLNSLAILNHLKGDNLKAAELYQRALTIREHALGPEHPDVATSLNNLANIYLESKVDFEKAEPLYRRALAIREKVLDPSHPDVAMTLYNLALYYGNKNDLAKAEPLCLRALSILEKALGPDHPYVAYPLNTLAAIYKSRREYDRAESLYQRAITIKEKAQSPYHPEVGGSLTNLANLYAVKGEIDKAITTQSRANDILEMNVALNLMTGSERQKLAYLESLTEIADRTLTLHLRTAPNNPTAAELAFTTILQRKGRVLDAMSASLAALRQRLNPQDQLLFDQLNETTSKLVGLVLNGPQDMTPAEHQQQVNVLQEQREKLESEISKRSAGFYEPARSVTLQTLRNVIPAAAALVEFSVYRPVAPEKDFDPDHLLDPDRAAGSRYVAYVVRREGELKWADLGEATEIDKAIEKMREALRDPWRKDVRQLSRYVDERVMQPVRALFGNAKQLLISPDGALNLIPFESLVDEHHRYLVERYSLSYLTSGHDLLRLQAARTNRSAPLVIVDPLFGEPEPSQMAQASEQKPKRKARSQRRQSMTTGANLAAVYFAPLSATELEGRAIQSLFPEAKLESGTRATETSLKQAVAPRILHIATHGFFLNGASSGVVTRGTRAISANVKIENPLLRSGLALAGANLHRGGDDDGILTALEASGLNLWGTKLVTLSACDTGLGEVKNGEGVYGLRRAFMLAGTETLVMSLWPVSDYVTRELMTSYYRGLNEGLGRGEALRQVQLGMLKRKERKHPFYWASFIPSGEWANLEGKRQ